MIEKIRSLRKIHAYTFAKISLRKIKNNFLYKISLQKLTFSSFYNSKLRNMFPFAHLRLIFSPSHNLLSFYCRDSSRRILGIRDWFWSNSWRYSDQSYWGAVFVSRRRYSKFHHLCLVLWTATGDSEKREANFREEDSWYIVVLFFTFCIYLDEYNQFYYILQVLVNAYAA